MTKVLMSDPEAVDGSQHVERELLIVFHVGGVYFQQIVVVARDVVALGDLGEFRARCA